MRLGSSRFKLKGSLPALVRLHTLFAFPFPTFSSFGGDHHARAITVHVCKDTCMQASMNGRTYVREREGVCVREFMCVVIQGETCYNFQIAREQCLLQKKATEKFCR